MRHLLGPRRVRPALGDIIIPQRFILPTIPVGAENRTTPFLAYTQGDIAFKWQRGPSKQYDFMRNVVAPALGLEGMGAILPMPTAYDPARGFARSTGVLELGGRLIAVAQIRDVYAAESYARAGFRKAWDRALSNSRWVDIAHAFRWVADLAYWARSRVEPGEMPMLLDKLRSGLVVADRAAKALDPAWFVVAPPTPAPTPEDEIPYGPEPPPPPPPPPVERGLLAQLAALPGWLKLAGGAAATIVVLRLASGRRRSNPRRRRRARRR